MLSTETAANAIMFALSATSCAKGD